MSAHTAVNPTTVGNQTGPAVSDLGAASWDRLCALHPATSQTVFRDVMDACARPGTLGRFPTGELPQGVPAAVLPVLALADIMAPIGAIGSAALDEYLPEILAALSRVTGAAVTEASAARYVLGWGGSEGMESLDQGSHWSPETGTTLVHRVERIAHVGSGDDGDAVPGRQTVKLTGPGIPQDSELRLEIDGLDTGVFAARAALVSDFPSGVDCLFVTDDGTFVAVPRTTRIEEI